MSTAAAPDGPAPDSSAPDGPAPDGPARGDSDQGESEPERSLADAAIPLPAGGTLTALLLAGIAGELARRRRQFQRHRRPGERMATLSLGQRDLEAAARDAVADVPMTDWEAALRELARRSRESGCALPRVRLVQVGSGGASGTVRVHLAEKAEPVAPFRAVEDRVWELDPEWSGEGPGQTLAADGLGADAEDDLYPALVAVGIAGHLTVLVNVDEVGTLRIAGTPQRRVDVLRALAAEACFGRVRRYSTRTLCVADATIAGAVEAGDLVIDRDPQRVAVTLAAVMGARQSAPSGGEPGSDEGRDLDPIEIVIADRGLPIDVPARSGAALITTAEAARPGAILALDAGGGAVLLPEGIRVVPQSLPAPSAADLVGLVAATDLPEDPIELQPSPLHAEDPAGDRVAVAGSARTRTAEGRRQPPGGGSPERSAPPTILVLGEVRVEGATGRAESARVGRLAETASFVLLNPDSRPSALQSALWPGLRSNPQTCRQMISRTRTWLGRNEEGDPYLLPFTETGGRLRLRPEVGSDWAQFQDLAGVGLADPEDIEHLSAALQLVRGRPFGPVAGRELPWADLAINDMIALITDVAHALACRHEAAGRWSAARDAALRGLRTECESEVLQAVLARLPGSD